MHPLTTRVRKYLIFKIGGNEVTVIVTCSLNPGDLTVVCEVTNSAVGMWLENMETNPKEGASAQNRRMIEQAENMTVSSPAPGFPDKDPNPNFSVL